MISFSTSDILAVLYLIAWPWIACVLLLFLVGFWSFRSTWPKFYVALVLIEILGSLPAGVYWISERHQHSQWIRENDYWNSVSKAANSGNEKEAIRLLATRHNGLRSYVERSLDGWNDGSNTTVMRVAFEQCVDLLDDRTESISPLLAEAVDKGYPDIIRIWLDSTSCANLKTTRQNGIRSMLNLLVPYPLARDIDPAKKVLESRQAEALRLLVERYPALMDVPVSEDCGRKQHGESTCPTLVMALLEKGHQEGVAAILPLDTNAPMHVPPVVLHVLRGETLEAVRSARADPENFHRYLPNLLATAPLESLQSALRAAPPTELSLLSPENGDTLYQHLAPLFESAERRDADQADWRFLWVLFDLFPARLRELDTRLYGSYIIGTHPGDANLDLLIERLRGAGLSCDKFQSLATRMTADDWFRQKSGCLQ